MSRFGQNNAQVIVGVRTSTESLPRAARLPINRCNLPAAILGGLTFQRHPTDLKLDGVEETHARLFAGLRPLREPAARARLFMAHMNATFSLEHPEEAGLDGGRGRPRAHYLNLLRGWAFDADGREGAVLKGWVESRFGLLPRHHGGPLRDHADPAWQHYMAQRCGGLYNTNALEAQLDLLYAYCQHELARRHPGQTHLTLYRGVNAMDAFESLGETGDGQRLLLLNNLNSFSHERERAGEFGDIILQARVPLAKVCFFQGLLPGRLAGEAEHAVIGGVYAVERAVP